jgi:lipoyl-dependent peroxiredoxin
MALSSNLEKAGATPKSVRTSADMKFEKTDAGFTIVGIDLVTQAEASGIDAEKFQTVAQETKKGCPVSRALAAVERITLNATLK